MVKMCTICDEEFTPSDGRRKRCDDCTGNHAAWSKKYRKENAERGGINTVELVCARCKVSKPTTEFFMNRSTKTGFHSRCKECFHRPNEQRYAAALWVRYRLRVDDLSAMLAEQNEQCKLCYADLSRKNMRVDHAHSCTHPEKGSECCKDCVRGLLCHPCNVFAGYLEKRIHMIDRAVEYVAPGTRLRIPTTAA